MKENDEKHFQSYQRRLMIWLETTAIVDGSADSTAAKGPKHIPPLTC